MWHVARQQVELMGVSGCLLDMKPLKVMLRVEVKHLKVRDVRKVRTKGFLTLGMYSIHEVNHE